MARLGWETFLKLASLGAFALISVQAVLLYIFQNNGYDSFWLSITLMVSVVVFIVLRLVWRITTKKFPF